MVRYQVGYTDAVSLLMGPGLKTGEGGVSGIWTKKGGEGGGWRVRDGSGRCVFSEQQIQHTEETYHALTRELETRQHR